MFYNWVFSELLFVGVYFEFEVFGFFVMFVYDGDLEVIGGLIDFYGINFYNLMMVIVVLGVGLILFDFVLMLGVFVIGFGLEWLILFEVLCDFLIDLYWRYLDLFLVVIGENGVLFFELLCVVCVEDMEWIVYLVGYIVVLFEVMDVGVFVEEYIVWLLFDNWEWVDGYM